MSPIYNNQKTELTPGPNHIYIIGSNLNWLNRFINFINENHAKEFSFKACSNLKEAYQDDIQSHPNNNTFIVSESYLKHGYTSQYTKIFEDSYIQSNVILAGDSNNPSTIKQALNNGIFFFISPSFTPELVLQTINAAINTEVTTGFEQINQETSALLESLKQASFNIKTPTDARKVSNLLSQLAPNSKRVATGLLELSLNAIEHGNLEIGFKEKTTLLDQENFQETVSQKLKAPEFKDKKVTIEFSKSDEKIIYKITDEGLGFEPNDFFVFNSQRSLQKNGRGILIAKSYSFDQLHYENSGRTAVATVFL